MVRRGRLLCGVGFGTPVLVGYVRERETVPASHFKKDSLTKGAAPCLFYKWLVAASSSAPHCTAAAGLEHLPSGLSRSVICVVFNWSV